MRQTSMAEGREPMISREGKEVHVTLKHFLVPLDFSEYANLALEYAIGLANKLQARLTLLHVIHELPIGAGDMATALPASYLEDLEAGVKQRMEAYRQQVQEAGLEVDLVIEHGVPFQRIVDVARQHYVDLIVTGTHGHTGLQHVLLGSVAEKVVRLAPCPVLVARGPITTTAQ
jgi:nucleotide-binding universal stress UspA family protein